jgi:hypothetical protein
LPGGAKAQRRVHDLENVAHSVYNNCGGGHKTTATVETVYDLLSA